MHFLKCPQQWSVEVLWSHKDTRSVVYLWTSDQPLAETSKWQQATLIRQKNQCPRRDWNPQSQQTLDCAATRLPYTGKRCEITSALKKQKSGWMKLVDSNTTKEFHQMWLRRSKESHLRAVQHTFRISQNDF